MGSIVSEKNVRSRVIVVLGFLLFVGFAFGQNISGSLTGTVKDPAGAVIPRAEVKLTNPSTGALQTSATNEAGVFLFASVLPGSYSVEISGSGFQSYRITNVEMTLNERRSLGDVVLQVGQAQQRVEVQAEVTPVQTASSERA